MDKTTGWGDPRPSDERSKYHWFGADNRSLCGKWGRVGGSPELYPGNDESALNCAECKRKKANMEARP